MAAVTRSDVAAAVAFVVLLFVAACIAAGLLT